MSSRATDEQILQQLRAGATYAEIYERLGNRNPTRIAQLRREHGIPVVWRTNGRTPEQTYALYATPAGDGHARWAGAWSGRMPAIHLPGTGRRKESALRFAFRQLHGSDPIGYVRPGCGQPWCVAGDHLTDRLTRTQPTTPTQAIALMIEHGASDWQIVRRLQTNTTTVTRIRNTARPVREQR
jgi:hypothetical protein